MPFIVDRARQTTVEALAKVLRLRAKRRDLLFQLCGYTPPTWTAGDYARAGMSGVFRAAARLAQAAVEAVG
jgi:hypothetical protein